VANITVIEDNRVIAFLIEASLKAANHTPTLCVSGNEGLQAMRAAPPDLLVLDVNLPDISGFDVALTMRQEVALSHVPILMLTALNDIDNRVRGLEVADDYLTKPFEKREFLARVGALLRRNNRVGALTGQLELIGGAGAAVQVVALVHSKGALVFDDGVTVYFDGGRVIHVDHKRAQSAETVIAQAFDRQQGSFRFEPHAPLPPATLNLDPMGVLLEVTRLADEAERNATNRALRSADTVDTRAKGLTVVPSLAVAEKLLCNLRGTHSFVATERWDSHHNDTCVVLEGDALIVVALHSKLKNIPPTLTQLITDKHASGVFLG